MPHVRGGNHNALSPEPGTALQLPAVIHSTFRKRAQPRPDSRESQPKRHNKGSRQGGVADTNATETELLEAHRSDWRLCCTVARGRAVFDDHFPKGDSPEDDQATGTLRADGSILVQRPATGQPATRAERSKPYLLRKPRIVHASSSPQRDIPISAIRC